MTIFVYGELCKPLVLLEILGRVPSSEPALLDGFSRKVNPETGYFHAVRHPTDLISGLLLKSIKMKELEKLDCFENVEGGEYERLKADVKTLRSLTKKTAWVYVAT